jgi:quercetin dioxygenase-like cupin family protein
MKARMLVLLAGVAGAFILGGGVVLAAGVVTVKPLANGTIARSTDIGANGIEFSSRQNAQVIVQQVDFPSGVATGWHTHPGLTVVTVTSGTVTFHSRCNTTTHTAGTASSSFVERPNTPVNVEDNTAGSAQVVTTLIVPAGMAARTNLATGPDCTQSNDDERSG